MTDHRNVNTFSHDEAIDEYRELVCLEVFEHSLTVGVRGLAGNSSSLDTSLCELVNNSHNSLDVGTKDESCLPVRRVLHVGIDNVCKEFREFGYVEHRLSGRHFVEVAVITGCRGLTSEHLQLCARHGFVLGRRRQFSPQSTHVLQLSDFFIPKIDKFTRTQAADEVSEHRPLGS